MHATVVMPILWLGTVRSGASRTQMTSSSAMVDTSDEWITTRSGIKERRIASGE